MSKNQSLHKWAITAACVLVAGFDTYCKPLSPISAGALALAFLPWIVDRLESFKAPGGLEMKFRDAKQTVETSSIQPQPEDKKPFEDFSSDDPSMYSALLRVEIERRIRRLAEENGVATGLSSAAFKRPTTLRNLCDKLAEEQIISKEARSLIYDLLPALNRAVHGEELGSEAKDFVVDYGPKVLAILRQS